MNTIHAAQKKKPTLLMRRLAKEERQSLDMFLKNIASGKTVILKNRIHDLAKPCAVGKGLRTKVNVNLGVSTDICHFEEELEKLGVSERHGADTVMDLSVGQHSRAIRKRILNHTSIPLGTVPIYEIVQRVCSRKQPLKTMTQDDVLSVIKEQAKEGVDFFTIHAGVTKEIILKMAKLKKKRLLGIVSRGGALIAEYIRTSKKENPLYEYFDDILAIAKAYDITLSLGDGLRPGSIVDATDEPQLYELRKLGELARRARKQGVQVIIEGPGHVPLNQIERNIKLQKQYCNGAPFYVLGPLVTDVASGYDHISAAIGGTLAGYYGADFLCYVTPAEHLKLPSIEEVKEGLIATRIAAHAADIAKGIPGQLEWDRAMSGARVKHNWEKQIALSINPLKAHRFRTQSKPHDNDVCTMCGEFCSIKVSHKGLH